MTNYAVTIITDRRQRLRASVIANTSVDACKTGHRCAIAAGYTPVSVAAKLMSRAA